LYLSNVSFQKRNKDFFQQGTYIDIYTANLSYGSWNSALQQTTLQMLVILWHQEGVKLHIMLLIKLKKSLNRGVVYNLIKIAVFDESRNFY